MKNLEYLKISNSNEYLGLDKAINKIKPLVSVMVTTYQHEKYISQCLDSILQQNTQFDFEIVIGEDGSSDNTRNICKEYAIKFPDKIRLHLRDRSHTAVYNSDGSFYKTLNGLFALQSCRGKYIAICEGDDYWIDRNKLQDQFDILEQNPNINLCFHNYIEFNDFSKQFIPKSNDLSFNIKYLTPSEVIIGDGSLMATCSLFFNKNIVSNLPVWVYNAPVGDYFVQVLGSLGGGVIYLNKIYSVYRTNHNSSWTSTMKNPSRIIIWHKNMIRALDELDKHTNHNYSNEIDFIKCKVSKLVVTNINIDYNFRRSQYHNYKKLFDFKFKLKWILFYKFKHLHSIYLKLRRQ